MILVTGATGKVGSEVVKQLAARGAPVRALVRSPEKARAIAAPGVEIARGDLGDPGSLGAAMEGVEALFLLTPPDPRQVEWQHNAIEAAKRAGVRHVVKLSAIGASEHAPVQLGRWHWQTEEELKASGLGWTILQPGFFMQNFLGFAPTIQGQGAFYSNVNGRVALVDARDIAAVAVAALTEDGHEGQTYVITGGEAISYPEAAEKLSAALGRGVNYVEIPDEAMRSALLQAGLPDWFADDLLALNAILNAGHAATPTDVVATVAKKEPIRFDQFARDHAAAFGAAPAAV